MKSPFPGMDPWLENPSVFPDFHDSLTFLLKEELNALLPPGYIANINRLVWVDDDRWRKPDVSTFGPSESANGYPDSYGTELEYQSGGTMLAIADDEAEEEPWSQQYLEILDTEGNRLVTAIEVLSPSNKIPDDRANVAYKKKQRQFLHSGVNLVELDLLRTGSHTTAVSFAKLRGRCGPYDYHICVAIPRDKKRLLAAFRLPDPLPKFVVPLDPGVPFVEVDLQPLFERTYKAGRYSTLLKYHRQCYPTLTAEQKRWAEEMLNGKMSEANHK